MATKIISNKIVILEDSVVYAKFLKKNIETFGYNVVAIFNDVKDIVSKILELAPDILIADIELNSDQNGIDIARQVRTLMSLPIIFVTASEELAHLESIAKMENTFFINKPHSVPALLFTIKRALAKSKVDANLLESEERYRKLVEMSPDTIIIHAQGKIKYVNKTGLELFGVMDSKALKNKHILKLVHEEDRQNIKEILFKYADQEVIAMPIEHRILSAKGDVHDVQTVSSVVSFDGRPAVMAVVRDITEIKQREKELKIALKYKEWLMREFSHRVGNQLNLINSFMELIMMSDENISVEELSREIMTRINTIVSLQTVLYRYNDFDNVNIFVFVYEIVDKLKKLNNTVNFKININEDYELIAEKASALGFWLNEVIVNSFKHAFNEKEKPEINIEIELIDNNYWVVVTDNGKGKDMEQLMITDERFSLGMSLVLDILPKKINGAASFYSEKGKFTKYLLDFKK